MQKKQALKVVPVDGDMTHVLGVSLRPGNGMAFLIKREMLSIAKDIAALKQCGIYFLYGEVKQEGKLIRKVYVGQAVSRKNGEGVFCRIKEHDSDKPSERFWTDAIAFVDRNNEWGPTEISYLENRFAELIYLAKKDSAFYELANGNTPNPGYVTKDMQWDLESYIEDAKTILQTLRYDFFDKEEDSENSLLFTSNFASSESYDENNPLPTQPKTTITPCKDELPALQSPQPSVPILTSSVVGITLFLKGKKVDANAIGEMIDTGRIRVKAGSIVSRTNNLSGQKKCDSIKSKRDELERNGVILNRTFTKDYVFNSPSEAATIILGTSSSGNERWRTKDGIRLGDLRNGAPIKNNDNQRVLNVEPSKEQHSPDVFHSSGSNAVLKGEEVTLFDYSKASDDSPASQEKKKDSPKTSVLVAFPDGTIIQHENVADTLVATIEKIGPEKIVDLPVKKKGEQVVSRTKHIKYESRQTQNGFFVLTHSDTKTKIRYLKKLSELLNLGLQITEI